MFRLYIVGVTDLYVHDLIDERTYNKEIYALRELVRDKTTGDSAPEFNRGFDDRISFGEEYYNFIIYSINIYLCRYKFELYRHWNLYDSISHSRYVASKLKTWKEMGRKKLHKLFVNIGKVMIIYCIKYDW